MSIQVLEVRFGQVSNCSVPPLIEPVEVPVCTAVLTERWLYKIIPLGTVSNTEQIYFPSPVQADGIHACNLAHLKRVRSFKTAFCWWQRGVRIIQNLSDSRDVFLIYCFNWQVETCLNFWLFFLHCLRCEPSPCSHAPFSLSLSHGPGFPGLQGQARGLEMWYRGKLLCLHRLGLSSPAE